MMMCTVLYENVFLQLNHLHTIIIFFSLQPVCSPSWLLQTSKVKCWFINSAKLFVFTPVRVRVCVCVCVCVEWQVLPLIVHMTIVNSRCPYIVLCYDVISDFIVDTSSCQTWSLSRDWSDLTLHSSERAFGRTINQKSQISKDFLLISSGKKKHFIFVLFGF